MVRQRPYSLLPWLNAAELVSGLAVPILNSTHSRSPPPTTGSLYKRTCDAQFGTNWDLSPVKCVHQQHRLQRCHLIALSNEQFHRSSALSQGPLFGENPWALLQKAPGNFQRFPWLRLICYEKWRRYSSANSQNFTDVSMIGRQVCTSPAMQTSVFFSRLCESMSSPPSIVSHWNLASLLIVRRSF